MGWTPPSKLMVIITFLLMAFGVFIFMDLYMGLWTPILPSFPLAGYNGWFIIGLVLYFLTWFLFFLSVRLKGI